MKLDEYFNIDVDTSKAFYLKGFLTAEVPDIGDGCRLMNPVPIRLPVDVEVCGLETVTPLIQPTPHKYEFVAGVNADLKWTGKELLEMFDVTGSI